MYTRIAFLSLLAAFFISSSACLAAPPVLGVSPTYMEFAAYEGGANPDPNILSIWRDGGNGPLNWTVTEDCNWLTVDPNSGTSMGEVDDCNVIVDINGLTNGVYSCQLTVDAGTAANSPQIVDVNLFVYSDINLVAWWKFDDGSGSTAIDSSSGGNDGTLQNGPIWTTGRIDGALDFDGSNDYVDVADSASLSFTNPGLTIAAWIYLNQDQSEARAIVRKENQWQLGIYPADNKIRNLVQTDGTNGWTSANDESYTINTDTWYFFAFTYNGSVLKHYANGAQVGSDKTVTGNIVDNSNNVAIASNTGGGSNNVNGKIDDVRIYDRALSAGEIRQLCAEGFGGRAFNPNPDDGQTQVDPNTILSWSPNPWASDVNGHDVYLGTDFNDVNDATTASAEYMGRQDTNSYDPCGLDIVTTYYWRIDEVNDPNVWKGDVWSFRTGTPLIELSAAYFEFTAVEGGANPNDQVLTITNTGVGTLNWQIAEDCNWLTADPNSGSSTAEADDANLGVDIAGLAGGIYNCQLTVSDSNASNSPQIVDVDLYVRDGDGQLYVPSEYPTIQEAIDVALNGEVVIVSPGTYNENITFGGKNITVSSTNPDDWSVVEGTVIQGDGSTSVVTFSGSEISSCSLTGFKVTGGNGSGGGGIKCNECSTMITKCIITGNSGGNGGGIGRCRGKIYKCIIYGNNGLGIYCYGDEYIYQPRIYNCIIYNNSGGGVYLGGHLSQPVITNCTIADNIGIGLSCYTSEYDTAGHAYVTNSIFWGNSGYEIRLQEFEIELFNCDIEGGTSGIKLVDYAVLWFYVNNIAIHPLFVDPNNENYHLKCDSPCIDTGTNSPWLGLPSTDLDGQARPIDGDSDGSATADMGAYEFVADSPIIGFEPAQFEFFGNEAGSNPAAQILSIRNQGIDSLNWEVTEDCSWLMVSPTSGTASSETDEVTLDVDITGLAPGSYNCEINITSDNACNSGEVVDVDLIVYGPEIGLSAAEVLFSGVEGGVNPADQILEINNIGGGTLNWEITEDCNWLVVEPNSGSSTGEADDVNLSVDMTGLDVGVYDCNLTISDSNASNSPQIVAITLHIGDADGKLHVPSEYSTIQEAIDVALDGDTVIVAEGTYTGTGNRDLDFGDKAITVQSTDPEDPCVVASTVIDCENVSGHRGFYFHSGEDANSIVAGLTVKRGMITGDPAQGGGIYCSGASPTIENCIIIQNKCLASNYGNNAYGGGIYCESTSNPRIINCLISNNEAQGSPGGDAYEGGDGIGGGMYCSSSNAAVENCIIANNTVEGGAGGVDPPIFFGYKGGGAHGGGIYAHSAMVIDNCIIRNNSATGGYGGLGTAGGGGAHGAGIRSASATNCTVVNNTATGGDGDPPGSSCGGISGISSTTIINCIVWGNGDDLGGCSATYSCIEDGDAGTGNISSDPCFVSGPEGDYYLSQTAAGQAVDSPCVDAGSDTAANLGFDVYTTRTDSWSDWGTVDMGYHYPISFYADIDENWHVEFVDFANVAADWLECSDPCAPAGFAGDITRDNCVDVNDLEVLIDCWLDCYVTKAAFPNPSDNQAGVDPNVILSWMAGDGALNHDVYFGTDTNMVAEADHLSAVFMGTVNEPNFDPCGLDRTTKYYWRIDEVGPACMADGDVWSFTTGIGLVSWWKFDEGSGTTAYDSAGNNDGNVYDANWTTGQIDGALDFDGSGDYVDVADSASLSFTGPGLTITAWVYLNQDQSEARAIVRKENQWQLGIYPATDTIRNLVWTDGTNGWTAANDESYTINPDTWYFFAFTYNGSVLKHYANGAQVGSDKTVTGNIVDNSNNVGIGSNTGGGSNNVNGKIDDVRIYDRALSDTEIWQLYQDGLP